MEQIASLRSCLHNDGNFDPAKFAQYRNQRCQYFDEDEEEELVVPKKRKFAHRHYEGYDPQSALCSEWYRLTFRSGVSQFGREIFSLFSF